MEQTHRVIHLMRVGDCFAFDGGSYEGGDVLYGEVLESLTSFDAGADAVGNAAGGYRVLMHCARDNDQGTPEGVTDHYSRDLADEKFVRLSRAQMDQAREAGWPSELVFLTNLQAM